MDPLAWVDDELERLECDDLLRTLPAPLRSAGTIASLDGRQVVNFASNDYLGLAADERLIAAAAEACREQGVGRGASPLICGRAESHARLEQRLAKFERTEAALLFPSGFAANAGAIPALADEGDAIYSDAKNHASIVDGCRLSRARCFVYPHGDANALELLLRDGGHYRRRLIVSDTLFSMDGDLAPLVELGELAERYDAMLLVDEAHATGVFGEQGRGIVEHLSVQQPRLHEQVHVRVGTLSKALGAAGGFVGGKASLVSWLANRARTYVFSTAQPAAASAAALAALDIVESEPWRRQRLLDNAGRLRQRLRELGWDLGRSASQIIPVIIGSPKETMRLARALREQGLWVGGIRPPSVPANESLLRIGLSAAHTDEMLDDLVKVLQTHAPLPSPH
jgi:8-amino-7-oxononanoate synthase